MFDKLFGNKKTRVRNILICIIPLVLVVIFLVVTLINSFSKITSGSVEEDNKNKIEEYNYVLRQNATAYQQELFEELKDSIKSGDDLKCAEAVVKNYIADFYTWTNKSGSYDVGGIYYVYSPNKKSIALDARMHFYKYLNYYINKFGNDKLLEVVNIEVLQSYANTGKYESIPGKSFDSFYIECSWDYNNYSFDRTTDYMKKGYFTVIKNIDGRYEIVEAWGDE